ncbi:protein of unknown function (plasmid) [Cupriavidus taiwanensis]|nr:protein of unknown function [Cupriavidus taiwanensis]SPD38162.1 protein of unknown function [Cupriavidus taiwanensis]
MNAMKSRQAREGMALRCAFGNWQRGGLVGENRRRDRDGHEYKLQHGALPSIWRYHQHEPAARKSSCWLRRQTSRPMRLFPDGDVTGGIFSLGRIRFRALAPDDFQWLPLAADDGNPRQVAAGDARSHGG